MGREWSPLVKNDSGRALTPLGTSTRLAPKQQPIIEVRPDYEALFSVQTNFTNFPLRARAHRPTAESAAR
jgi:hypothetical protein